MQLEALASVRVLVVGDVMLDRYLFGDTQRISPEAPVPIVKVNVEETRLGGACNVALNLASLGVDVGLIGITGNDQAGDLLTELCQKKDIDFFRIQDAIKPTICKQRIISKHQQLLRLDFEDHGAFDDVMMKELYQYVEDQIQNYDLLILSDYGKGSLSDVSRLIDLANQMHTPILIDPKGDDFNKYKNATLITPNQMEFETIVGKCESEEILLARAKQLREDLNLSALLVTRSEKGMLLIEENQDAFSLPAVAQDVFDVTGAGDTMIAVLGAVLATKASMQEACYYANTAAGIVIGKLGAAQVNQEELKQALAIQNKDILNQDVVSSKLETVDSLQQKIRYLQRHQKKIVMTNGCFDLVHKGHIDYLKKAKQLGDHLILALNTDSSIRNLKGPSRPVMSEESRVAVLSALECVDFVILFDEETPEMLIANLLPDVLVKGADYQLSEVAGAQQVLANNGRVELIEMTEGYSTSNLIYKILNTP